MAFGTGLGDSVLPPRAAAGCSRGRLVSGVFALSFALVLARFGGAAAE